ICTQGDVDRIGTVTQQFDDRIAGIVDIVGIVPRAAAHRVGSRSAAHRVGSRSAVENVVARSPVQDVVAGSAIQTVVAGVSGDGIVLAIAGAIQIRAAGQDETFDMIGRRIVDAGIDGVGAFPRKLDHDVAHVIDVINIVSGTTLHAVGSGSSV